jgi:hypothetical protein
MMKLVLFSVTALAVAACDAPPLKLVYEVAQGTEGQTCGSEIKGCSDIQLGVGCESVLSVRILSPDKPEQPHVKVCQQVQLNARNDLCSIAAIPLPEKDLPKETLEVQVLVWPKEVVTDPVTKEINCIVNSELTFESATGFPIVKDGPLPAFGGRTYFHPGDTETVVTLGCTYPETVTAATCIGPDSLMVTSRVRDFDSLVHVDDSSEVTVHIGEPEVSGEEYVFNVPGSTQLPPVPPEPPVVWGATVNLAIGTSLCIAVDEDTPQATTTLHCKDEVEGPPKLAFLDHEGVLLKKATLNQIIDALELPVFPDQGITIGIVMKDSAPVAGLSVGAELGAETYSVKYLSPDRKSVGDGLTTSNGIFISTDAPYGTTFRVTAGGINGAAQSIGGLVRGKVTIVLLQLVGGSA